MSIGPNGVDYTALQNEWPLLNPGTTAQKLAQLNAMTVTGAVPTLIDIPGTEIFKCLVWSEFTVLTATEQSHLWNLCQMVSVRGGSASTFVAPFFGTLAARMPNTITALVALSKGLTQPWWQANGYLAPINASDLIAAGGLT